MTRGTSGSASRRNNCEGAGDSNNEPALSRGCTTKIAPEPLINSNKSLPALQSEGVSVLERSQTKDELKLIKELQNFSQSDEIIPEESVKGKKPRTGTVAVNGWVKRGTIAIQKLRLASRLNSNERYRKVRYLYPVLRPTIISSSNTIAGKLGIWNILRRMKWGSSVPFIIVMILCAAAILYFYYLEKFDVALLLCLSIFPMFFPMLYVQIDMLWSIVTSFMPLYVLANLAGTAIGLATLQDNPYQRAISIIVACVTFVSIIWDALPGRIRSSLKICLLICASIYLLTSIDTLIRFGTRVDSANSEEEDHDSGTFPVRVSGWSMNVSLYCFHLFYAMLKGRTRLVSIHSKMQIFQAQINDLQALREQLQITEAWERRQTVTPKYAIPDDTDPFVRILFSPVPPFPVRTKKTIGTFFFGRRMGNIPYILHKRVPFFSIIAFTALGIYYTLLLLDIHTETGQKYPLWMFNLGLSLWGVMTTFLLANTLLCKIVSSQFEARFYIMLQTACTLSLLLIVSWRGALAIVSQTWIVFIGTFIDAWPSFIVRKRSRGIGLGANFSVTCSMWFGLYRHYLFGDLESSHSKGISLFGISLLYHDLVQSLIMLLGIFQFRYFLVAILRPDCCVLLKAPVLSLRVPQSDFIRLLNIHEETLGSLNTNPKDINNASQMSQMSQMSSFDSQVAGAF